MRLADGNVASGQGIIQKLPVTALSSAPAESAVAWTHLQTDHYTFKSARTLTDGSVIGLCWSKVGGWARQATLVYLSSSGAVTWGPTGFGTIHGEGTSVRRAMRRVTSQRTALLSARVRSRSVTIWQHDKHSSILAIVFFAACGVPRRAELCHFWHGPRAYERRDPGVHSLRGRVCSQHASRAVDQGQPSRGLAVEQVIQFH